MAILTASLLLAYQMQTMNSLATVTDLRCEYQMHPNVVESSSPRLSWITACDERDWKQSAYEVLVASNAKKLVPGQADLWDSGQVPSDSSIQVPYRGRPLVSRQRCYWMVRVWDATGAPSPWSRVQTWDMGLLDDRAWSASEWVGIQSSSREALPAPFLRKQFIAGNRIKRATVYACGLGYAELHLNGKKLGETTERDPGYTNFNKRVLYIAHDVTSSIKPGPNALGAILGTGWFDVHDIATWRFENAPWRGRPRLRLALFIDYTDGRTQTVVTDSTWRASSGPILFNGIYTGEIYDARLEMPGWDSSEFNDRSWSAVDVMPAPKGMLAARECPPVAITESIKPVRISETGPGVYLVDFGQNIAGHAQIRVKGPAGTRITMRYSERVRGDGAIERSQIDTFMAKTTPPQPFQTDTYICKGSGVE